jgi:hypothetical protein
MPGRNKNTTGRGRGGAGKAPNKPKAKRAIKRTVEQISKFVKSKVEAQAAIGQNRKFSRQKHRNANIRYSSIPQLIASGIANPISCPNLRFKTNPSQADCTVAVQLHTYTTVKQPSYSSASVYDSVSNTTQPLGTTSLFMFRDAFRAYIGFTTNPSNSVYSYTAWCPNTDVSAIVSAVPVAANAATYLAPTYFKATTVYEPHDKFLYTGIGSDSYHWCWMDLGTTMTFTQSTTTASSLYTYFWDGNTTQSVYSEVAFSSGVATFTCSLMGYYNFEILNTSTAYTVTVVYSGSSESYGHHAVANVDQHLTLMDQYRLDAASIMLSPVCASIAKNGAIVAGWLTCKADWWDYTSFGKVALLQNSRDFGFDKGVYAFIKPAEATDFNFNDTVKNKNGITVTCGFNLLQTSKFIAISATVDTTAVAGVQNIASGLEFMLTYVANIELVTNDQWHEMHLPPGKFDDFKEALEVLSSIEPFHENPLHWRDITSALKTGFNRVREHWKPISAALSALFPSMAPAIGAGGAFVGSLPEMR